MENGDCYYRFEDHNWMQSTQFGMVLYVVTKEAMLEAAYKEYAEAQALKMTIDLSGINDPAATIGNGYRG